MMQPERVSEVLKGVRVLTPILSLLAGSLLVVPALAAPARLEGTLSLTQSGHTQSATLLWEAPDHLRIEVPRDTATGGAAQIIVAAGNDTQIFDPNTRRLRHLGFNIAQKWWRGWGLSSGGPANFLLTGAPAGTVKEDEGTIWKRDKVLFGGSGTGGYYAAWKTKDRRWAREVTTTPTSRVEKNDAGRETLRATLQLNGELPQTVTLTANGATATYTYDLHARDAAFDAATWTLPDAGQAVLEADTLSAPAAYTGTDGTALYDRATAVLRGSEDVVAANALLDGARAAAPGASAPSLLQFEIALLGRNWSVAERALGELAGEGVAPEEIQGRRARLAIARRDFDGAVKALDAAIEAVPADASLKLRRAVVLRTQGKIDAARAAWTAILSDEKAPMVFRVGAVEALTQFAAPDEWKTLRDGIQGDSEPVKLARALFSLRLGEPVTAPTWSSKEALSLWALASERAGQDEAALVAWNQLEKSDDAGLQLRARAHKVTLAAQRGDADASLAALRAWMDSLGSEQERDTARLMLFDAWQKAFKQTDLGTALDNRANATAATNADLQMFLTYQGIYGDDDGTTRVLDTALARFADDPFWKSKRADQLATRAMVISTVSETSRVTRVAQFRQVFDLLNGTIAQAPDQPFYVMQRALIAAQRVAKQGLSDAATAVGERKAASDLIASALAAYPNDPDVELSAAISLFTLGVDSDLPRVVELANAALDSPPGDGDRHTLVFAARQIIAFASDKLNQGQEAAHQWQILLAGAQSSREQVQIASQYLGVLERTKATATAVDLVTQIAGDGWPSEDVRDALDSLAVRVVKSPLAPQILTGLRDKGTPAALLAWATCNQLRLLQARAALAVPGAPASADADLDRATRDLNASVGLLKLAADTKDPLLAGRAAAFLAQRAGLSPEDGLTYLRRAIALDPSDLALRIALADTLESADPASDEAKTQRRILSQSLTFTPESQRLLALLYWVANDDANAMSLSKEAMNVIARAPELTANDFQRMAFTRAHIAWVSGGRGEAIELYKSLSSDQWLTLDRAAALLGWRARALEDNQATEVTRLAAQIQTLDIDQKGLERAANFLNEVEN